MTSSPHARSSWLSLLWLAVWLLVCVLACVRFTPNMVQTDIKALLPQTALEQNATRALSELSEKNAKSVWVLIASPDWSQTKRAAQAFTQAMPASLQPSSQHDMSLERLRETYRPFAAGFLSDADRQWLLTASDKTIGQRALQRLYQPLSFSVLEWMDDPLGLFQTWLLDHDVLSRFSNRDGYVTLQESATAPTIVLTLAAEQSIQANADSRLTVALESARQNGLAACPSCSIDISGIALISEAVSSQASYETSLIGTLALLGILVITWLFFRHFKPIGYLLFVLASATAFAFCFSVVVFEQLHVLTFVFGATLLGVCVDYVFHVACALQSGLSGLQTRATLWRPLALSLLSTVLGYALMAITPMPGLHQMAVFCISGLVATFVTVMTTLPLLHAAQRRVVFYELFCQKLSKSPVLTTSRQKILFIGGCALVAIVGLSQLHTTNELRLLNSVPKDLLHQQNAIATRLSNTSPSQFFLVQGTSDDDTLNLLVKLEQQLRTATEQGVVTNYVSPHVWLGSTSMQNADAALVARANATAKRHVEQQLGTTLPVTENQSRPATPLDMAHFAPFASLWLTNEASLGGSAIVLLSGVDAESIEPLEQIAKALPGISFVNITQDIADSLAFYRTLILWIVLGSTLAIVIALLALYRRDAHHIFLPSCLSLFLTPCILGLLGIPLSLFTALPLILLLGLSVDYGLLMYTERAHDNVWASIFLAGSSTLLSFGLLAFSSTPALSHFGATILIGITLSWILTPLLRKTNA